MSAEEDNGLASPARTDEEGGKSNSGMASPARTNKEGGNANPEVSDTVGTNTGEVSLSSTKAEFEF